MFLNNKQNIKTNNINPPKLRRKRHFLRKDIESNLEEHKKAI